MTPRPSLDQLAIVATDFDGTLVGVGREVSDITRSALTQLADTHVEFVVITGRPPRYCDSITDQTGVPTTLICANGALGYDPATREVTQFATLQLDTAHDIIEDVKHAHPDAGFCAEMGDTFIAEQRWFEAAGRPVEGNIVDLRRHLDHRLHKLLVSLPDRTPDETLSHVAAVAGDRVNPMHAGLPFVELMPPGVDKAFGLRQLCESRGVAPHQVLTFGDMPNDVAMLDWAGWGVAVGNAHETAKAAADEVTRTNIDDGVAHILWALLGLEQPGPS
ncbi:MAG: Cof-type HAD-IIB family hydrolase [Actinomycetota bacterium]|nr:Cof-type HAD-IIB family hydrolase [Actinomycetota bacterium]